MPNHGKGGRKPEREEAKRAQIPVRTTPAIRARLDEAAKEAGRSLTQEIERRLEASLEGQFHDLSAETLELFATLAQDIRRAEKATGNRWHKNLVTWAWVREALASGEIERQCPENDRLLSDVDGIVSEQREALVKLALAIDYDAETIEQMGLPVVRNVVPQMLAPFTAFLINYEATEAGWEKADDGLKNAGRFLLSRMRKADEERSETGKLFEQNIEQFVKAIREGVELWEADLASRGVVVTREFRPSASITPLRPNVPGGMFGAPRQTSETARQPTPAH